MKENQHVLLVDLKNKKVEPFSRFHGQAKICRLCGGRTLANEKRLWNNGLFDYQEGIIVRDDVLYCKKFDLCCSVDVVKGTVKVVSNDQPILCNGETWGYE